MRQDLNFGKNFLNSEHTRKTCKVLTVVTTRKRWFSLLCSTQHIPVGLFHLPIHGGPQPDWPTEFPHFCTCLWLWPYMVWYANEDADKCTFLSI